MSDHIGDLVALAAKHVAELESRPYPSTIPCPPPDEETARFEQDAKKARIYLHACTLKTEVDRLVDHLHGLINGVEVDIAQLQPIHPRMSVLEEKLDRVLSIVEGLADNRMSDHQKVISLEKRLAQHARSNEHCDACPMASSAQEAE